MTKNKQTVFVGISGGVDSSVSAALLKDQGYDVVGVFIRTWTPDFIECTWRDERRDAMRVCAHLGIPFLECDAEKEYKKGVALYMIEEYKKGRTPNPDVMCNRQIKFGVFWNFAKAHGADYIATGHYAVITQHVAHNIKHKNTQKKCYMLCASCDMSKDQSYFLWTLTQEDLSHTLFPIGHLKKTEVRKLALKYKLPTATKKDSQGVCFLGPLDMKDFLRHYIKEKRGDVILSSGEVIGYHNGATFFTLGERHGFTITKNSGEDKPYYVVAKEIEKNTIMVSPLLIEEGVGGGDPKRKSPPRPLGTPPQKGGETVLISHVNWVNNSPIPNKIYQAQIRYHGELLNCKIEILKNLKANIFFEKNILVDSGQSIVIYDGDICLGGGIVESC